MNKPLNFIREPNESNNPLSKFIFYNYNGKIIIL